MNLSLYIKVHADFNLQNFSDRTRGSMAFSHNSGSSTPSNGLSLNSQQILISSPSSLSDSVYEEISTQYDTGESTHNSSPIITSDNLDNIQVSIDTIKNDSNEKKELNENNLKKAGFPSKKHKSAIPLSNAFSQQKKNKENNLELLLAKSSSAIQSMAACLTQDTLNETDKGKKMHPFVVAMEAAFEKVLGEKKMECFMAVMNVISTYQ